jgi:hypothetical protein
MSGSEGRMREHARSNAGRCALFLPCVETHEEHENQSEPCECIPAGLSLYTLRFHISLFLTQREHMFYFITFLKFGRNKASDYLKKGLKP